MADDNAVRILRRVILILAMLALAGVMAWPFRGRLHSWLMVAANGEFTIEQRLEQYGPAARQRLRPHFDKASITYPPHRLVIVGLKTERRLELYAAGAPGKDGDDAAGKLRFIRDYPILGASGVAGPKLRRGDRQVPEGLYRIELLNPNSRFHLSLRVNYPNDHDRAMAERDGRGGEDLGGDIMIHGGSASVGCLAMGDPAAEDLFVLAADTGLDHIELILAPRDLRNAAPPPPAENAPAPAPGWLPDLYAQITRALVKLPSKHMD